MTLLAIHFLSTFVVASGPFAVAASFEDDFFYYAQIARNIVETGRSTFDGVSDTNGYQPLWQWVLVGLFFGASSTSFLPAVWAMSAALVLLGVWVFVRLCRKCAEEGAFSEACIAPAAVLYGVAGVFIATSGMETAALWPLAPAFLLQLRRLCAAPTLGSAFTTLALLCLCVLARLDMAALFAPVCVAALALLGRRLGVAATLRLLPAGAALAPLLGYLVYNSLVFDGVWPISGEAKRLLLPGGPFALSSKGLASFVSAPNPNFLFVPIAVSVLTIIGAAIAAADARLRRCVVGRGFLWLCVGALLFYVQTLAFSDWRLWVWYFFPLCLTGSFSLALAVGRTLALVRARAPLITERLKLEFWAPLGLAIALALVAIRVNVYKLRRPATETNALFVRALVVREFARTHPGRYAMGDGAGIVAWVLHPIPLVQLEGLVNDRTFLREIKRGGPLADSLARQSVDYYVAGFPPGWGRGACLEMTEPSQSGPRAPRLRRAFARRRCWPSGPCGRAS